MVFCSQQPRIAVIASYVPRRCGIATFTHDLATAIADGVYHRPLGSDHSISIVAVNDRDGGYDYGPEVTIQIRQQRRQDYHDAAEILNASTVDVVSLQHEYGLFGGERDRGEYVLELLDDLTKPLVSTLHTVLSNPLPKQQEALERVCARSSAVVVMADRARSILHERYAVPLDRITLIHHGVPDVPFGDTEPHKERLGLSGRPTILTFGLLNPLKSIETTLRALAKVVPEHPDVAYIVLGVTHPAVRRESGEAYRASLHDLAVELGIKDNVHFHNRYVSMGDLCEYLRAADVYVTPYNTREQITSGTLAYALAAGNAIISTPYPHARELLANGRGVLFEFGDVDALAERLRELLTDENRRKQISRAAYAFGRQMVWPRVGKRYVDTFRTAQRAFASETASLIAEPEVLKCASQELERTIGLSGATDRPDVPIRQRASAFRRHRVGASESEADTYAAEEGRSTPQVAQTLPGQPSSDNV